MGRPTLKGIFSVKLPVGDLARSRAWYERVFGFEPDMEFADDDGVVRGIAGRLPGVEGTTFALRESPTHASGAAGFNLVNFAVEDKAAAEAWATRLDELGIEHSPVIDATVGWILVLHDPDGIEVHLYSQERHGIDQAGRPGYGRRISSRPSREGAGPEGRGDGTDTGLSDGPTHRGRSVAASPKLDAPLGAHHAGGDDAMEADGTEDR